LGAPRTGSSEDLGKGMRSTVSIGIHRPPRGRGRTIALATAGALVSCHDVSVTSERNISRLVTMGQGRISVPWLQDEV
jgi:hypothetical protein